VSIARPVGGAQPHSGTRKVAVCIATYQRPIGLARLVRGLQVLNVECGEALSLEVIIVDNDPAASASGLCTRLSRGSQWPITYVCEPRRGIPFARNTVVRCALGRGADYLALVDDDEVPDPTWLKELWLTMTHYAADIVAGPVLPHFEGPVARWILAGGFFDRPRPPTGTQLDRTRSGNVLVRADVFQRVGRLFDERFLVLGEDTDFFLHAARAGCTIVWANDAIVHESIPESRTRVMWLLRRSYSVGIFWGQFSADRAAVRRGAFRGMVKGAVWLPWSVFQGRAAAVRALQLIATGIGYLAARSGLGFREYQGRHGS
jgi:succinoglycan biosynthesis protein ExoM